LRKPSQASFPEHLNITRLVVDGHTGWHGLGIKAKDFWGDRRHFLMRQRRMLLRSLCRQSAPELSAAACGRRVFRDCLGFGTYRVMGRQGKPAQA
jgi:hypothetical protein